MAVSSLKFIHRDFYTCINLLLYLSITTILIDGIFGLDIFLSGSDRLSFIYRSAFLFKMILVLMSILLFSKIPKNISLLLIFLLLTLKLLSGIYIGGTLKAFLGHIYFYSFIFFGYIAGWQLARSNLSLIKVNANFLKLAIWLTLFICISYFSLYQLGYIDYFGLGLQTYIIVAIFLATQSSKFYHFLIFLTIILTGKRSMFLIYLTQLFAPRILSGRFSLIGILLGTITFTLFIYLSYTIGLIERFQGMLNLYRELDLANFDESRNLFYLATGGRTEEIYAYFIDQNQSFNALLFGQAPGYAFPISDLAGNVYQHYYFHISPFNMIFHFGIPLGVLIIIHQFIIFTWAIRHSAREKDIFCFLFIGFYLSSIFGATVIVDIFFWVLYFYCYFARQNYLSNKRILILQKRSKTIEYAS